MVLVAAVVACGGAALGSEGRRPDATAELAPRQAAQPSGLVPSGATDPAGGAGGSTAPVLPAVTGRVDLRLEPAEATLAVGDSVDVMVWAVADEGQRLDGVEVHLAFDPGGLEVVDGALSPAEALPYVLIQRVDNGSGRLDFAAGQLGEAATGRVPVLGFRLRLKVDNAAPLEVRFVRDGVAAPTEVADRGRPVLRSAQGLVVQAAPRARTQVQQYL